MSTHNIPPVPISHPPVRILRYVLPLILLGVIVYLVLSRLATIEESLLVIKNMPLWAVALAILAQFSSYLGSGYLVSMLVAVVGQKISVLRSTLIFTAASSVGLAGGGPIGNVTVTYRWLRGSGVSEEGALLAGWLPTLFYDAALILTGIFGLVHLLIVHQLSFLQASGAGVTLLVLITITGIILWGVYHRPRLTNLAVRVAKRWATLRKRSFDSAATEASTNKLFQAWDALRAGGWHGPALGALLNTLFDMLTLYFLFYAAGFAVSPGILLAGYGLPLLLGKISFFIPGGVGIVEASMAALYDGLGVPNGVTVVVIIVYRFLSFWLPLLIGFPIIAYLQRIYRAANNDNGLK